MSETEEKSPEKKKERKPLGLSKPGKLELKKTVGAGQVRQNFSHGRSKMVTVEVRKRRTFAPDSGGHMAEVPKNQPMLAEEDTAPGTGEKTVKSVEAQVSAAAEHLTNTERETRARVLEEAHKQAEIEANAPLPPEPAEPEVDHAAEETAVVDKKADAEDRRKQAVEETEKQRLAEKDAATAAAAVEAAAAKPQSRTVAPAKKPAAPQPTRRRTEERRPSSRRGEPRRRSGRLTISEALGGREERTRSLAAVRRAREKEKKQLAPHPSEAKKKTREVIIPETITVQELANRMAERATEVIKKLMAMGVMATINQTIDTDTAQLIVEEFGHRAKRVSESDVEIGLGGGEDDEAARIPRAPVVTIMGHVDHGKTSLLDALRETDVVSGEAGGITQHIGAYQVTLKSGNKITFVDTPGHAAFTEMRARGAEVTDIVVLVVAADDSVMPQTIEAIHHAKAAEVPIIVAINKIDLPDANPDRVRQELLQHDLVVEEMGGDILNVAVSAIKKTNLDKLEEAILLQAEILDLRVNPDRTAEGVIVESRIERGRGPVSTVLVQRGTLCIGDIFVAGAEWGRVRAMNNSHGTTIKEAGPSEPVEVLGAGGVALAGDDFVVVASESKAREISEFRQRQRRNIEATKLNRGTLEEMFERIQEGEAKTAPVIIKGDVHGSVEAIKTALEKMGTDEVKAHILHAGVGGINESDITLANATNAFVIGFNVRANPQARDMARRDGVEIRYYSIIYDVTDDLRKMLSGMMAPEIRETFLGNALIKEVFNITKVGRIAGCVVTEGTVRRGARVRLLRDDVVIHEGELSQLKRFKDDVKEVKEGNECGMAFANYQDLKVKDIIECFEVEEVVREL